jgi:hypothetical protein
VSSVLPFIGLAWFLFLLHFLLRLRICPGFRFFSLLNLVRIVRAMTQIDETTQQKTSRDTTELSFHLALSTKSDGVWIWYLLFTFFSKCVVILRISAWRLPWVGRGYGVKFRAWRWWELISSRGDRFSFSIDVLVRERDLRSFLLSAAFSKEEKKKATYELFQSSYPVPTRYINCVH